ncbi:MAG: HAMP domain-containing sensor histidine kinase [Verrucomicrobiota bacterium]
MAAASPTLRWLYLAVLGPLVVLAFMAWAGSRSELKAAWTDAREQAERITRKEANRIADELAAATTPIPFYPDPPPPGEPSEFDEVLDSSDLTRLTALRNNPKAGFSPAGLPRQVLAALRIHEINPNTEPAESLVRLLTLESPSVLTSHALKSLNLSSSTASQWHQSEQARELLSQYAEPPSNGAWARNGDETWWLRSDGNRSNFITPEILHEILTPGQDELPSWGSLVPRDLNNATLNSHQVVLASHEVPYGPGTSLDFVADASQFTGSIRKRQRWILAILSVATFTAIISLFTIHRTVVRERHLAELKSQFVSSVSHELRAPLGSIRLMAEALHEEKTSKPAEFHKLIAREGARLSHLVENVLDFARIEEGRKRYQFEETDLKALIEDTLQLMQPLALERKITFHAELADITATLDPAAIQQALINLLDNALKFSPEGSIVIVAADWIRQANQSSVSIRITDQGPGIPRKDQQVIFERFHRLGNELRRETQGTGIGLSIVRHVAEAHHGTIRIDSTPPDGSTFILTLPQSPSSTAHC